MTEVFDPNKAVAEIVKKLAESAAGKAWAESKVVFKSVYLDAKVFTTSHTKYVKRVAKDFYKAKSFLNPQTKTPLYDFYVPLGIVRGDTQYPEATISNLTLTENFNVITGSGGSGKSMMMRHLFLDTLKAKDKVPVFVELRDLNDGDLTLLELIGEALFTNGFARDDEFFTRAMKAGHFAIFLDGFDETEDKARVSREIQRLVKDYSENLITVSSRPDDLFAGWTLFNVWKIAPLTLGKASELVEKVPHHIFDSKLREKFLADLKEKLFESHRSFLSNPLLLSIMVLTYKDSADIPRKLSVFYDQAFTTLFHRHDAAKGFTRKRLCKELDIQDFARIFSAFSILSFDKKKTTFSENEALEFLGKAKKFVDVDFTEKHFLEDSIQAVSLLVRDGLTIAFSHRSFQEYFAAQYIRHLPPDKQQRLIGKYIKTSWDAVIDLLYDLSPEAVETSYLIPRITELENSISWNNTQESYVRFLEQNVRGFDAIRFIDSANEDDQSGNMFFPMLTPPGDEIFGLIGFVFMNYLPEQRFGRYLDIRAMSAFSTLIKETVLKETGVDLKTPPTEKTPETQLVHHYPVQRLLENSTLLSAMGADYGILSFGGLKSVFDVRDQIIQKHENRGVSIEEELLSS